MGETVKDWLVLSIYGGVLYFNVPYFGDIKQRVLFVWFLKNILIYDTIWIYFCIGYKICM